MRPKCGIGELAGPSAGIGDDPLSSSLSPRRVAGWLVAWLWLAAAGSGRADVLPAPEVAYSADVRLTTLGGGASEPGSERVGRVWYSDGKRRREMGGDGIETLVIERSDLGVRWSRMPGTELFSELPIGRAARGLEPDPTDHWGGELHFEKRGREEVNGVRADRYEVTAKRGAGTAWLTPEKVPVRYEGTFRHGRRETRLRVDYTNIRIGAQDTALFELPEGVKPIPRMPVSTHGPGSDRTRFQQEMQRQMQEMRERYGAQAEDPEEEDSGE